MTRHTRQDSPPTPPPDAHDDLASDPRARACDALTEQCARHPELPAMTPDEAGLDPRDAALAHSIYDGAIRRRVTLKPLISAHLNQNFDDVEPGVQAALLSGATQLLLLDRVPAHAALDRTVEWAKHRMREGAGKLVNAVLRRVASMRSPDPERAHRTEWTNRPDEIPLSDGRALVIPNGLLPDEPASRTAIAFGIPKRLFARWCDDFGHDDAEHLAAHSIIRPPTILNIEGWRTRHGKDAGLPPGTEAHESVNAAVWGGYRADLHELLAREDSLWVQDDAAAEPLRLLREHPPETLHDLCAGRGTKTTQALALFPEARVIATDTNPERVADLRARFGTHDRVTVLGFAEAIAERIGSNDAVLLDVPCSNTGVLARRVEARHRATKPVLARLVQTQRTILGASSERLPPGARLLYATCSVDTAENDDQTEWARSDLGLRLLHDHRALPRGTPGGEARVYRDGSYAALFQRSS